MDSLTQCVLGAAIGESMVGRKIGGRGAIIGAAIATIPDLDVILYLFYNKLDMLSIHRGFSHSIVFSIIGGLLTAAILSRFRSFLDTKFRILFLFAFLCLFTHIVLDTFTAYGTQLLLPFSDHRYGLDSINVVDPVYTIPMTIGLLVSLRAKTTSEVRSKYNTYGIIISTLYLVFTLWNKSTVESNVSKIFTEENVSYDALMTMPVGVANIKWYGVAKGQDSIHLLQYSTVSKRKNNIESFAINNDYLDLIDDPIAEKMRWFAKGFYTVEKVDDAIRIYNLQVDMRGSIEAQDHRAPTIGYFEVSKQNGAFVFSSGSIKQK